MNKEALRTCFNISCEELERDLAACQLPEDKPDYTSGDENLLKQYRELVVAGVEEVNSLYQEQLQNGKSPAEALTHLASVVSTATESEPALGQKTVKRWKGKVPVALFDLLKAGQKLTGKPISLSRGLELLQASGLSEQSDYAQEEVNRFLETCDLIVNQGKSLAEVTQNNGAESKNNFS
ncbi:MAG: hypothetical protein ACRDEA_14450, partial [Microcystaceae cyanobacterium]